MTVHRQRWDGAEWGGDAPSAGPALDYDWSDSNPPWAYTSTDEFTARFPVGTVVVPLQTGGADFYTDLHNTVNAAGERCVVELPAGIFSFDEFKMIGSSGDPKYSFGFWNPNLQGLLGQGPDKTFIEMAPDSMTQTQLDSIALMTRAAFAPLQMGVIRIDGSMGKPVLMAGLTGRSHDQNDFTSTASDMQDLYWPQPAPHNGFQAFNSSYGAIFDHVRFQGFGRAINSAPPFEMSNVGTQYEDARFYNCESDGRRSPDIDPAQPLRCTVHLGNNAEHNEWVDSWLHDTNISRYAINDENRDTYGDYILTRCKIERITINRNSDPALNNGNSLGGWTDASLCGWESVAGTITVTDCILNVDNPHSDSGQKPMHYQLTSVGSRNPTGGRMYSQGTVFNNSGQPHLQGYLTIRVAQSTDWYLSGYGNTMFFYDAGSGARLAYHQFTGSWPPTQSYLDTNGLDPTTHYIVGAA